MQFIITAYDGDNMLEKRMAVRPRHLEGMAALSDHIVCAGGLLDEDGKLPKAKEALLSDAIGTVVGAAFGTSTVTSYVESSAGAAAGGRRR